MSRPWGAAELAVERLMKRVPVAQRSECIRLLFAEGPALGWLTNLLRSEIFSHGHFGNRAEPESQRLLTTAEFEDVLQTMLSRYERASAPDLLSVPNLLSLLYAWKQGAGVDSDPARAWVAANIRTDAELLRFLSRARGWSSGSGGVRYPLRRGDLENFLNYESARQRVERIANDSNSNPESRKLATELVGAFRDGTGEWQ
jgi:hypothetical protein